MRRIVLFLLLPAVFASCRSARPTYAVRLEQARARLREIARRESAARSHDPELFLIRASLDPTLDPFEGQEHFDSPIVNQQACDRAFHPLLGQEWKPPDDETAEELLVGVERAMPGSSLVPMYRLQNLLLHARERPRFIEEATDLVEEALRRNDFRSPARTFRLRVHTWLVTHERDLFAQAAIQPTAPDRHMVPIRYLAHMVKGAALSPSKPRPEILRLAEAVRQVADDRLRHSPDQMDTLVSLPALRDSLEALFLLQWRAGDFRTATVTSEAFDEVVALQDAGSAFGQDLIRRLSAQTWYMEQSFRRVFDPILKSLTGPDRKSVDEVVTETQARARAAAEDVALQEEAHRRVEATARTILRLREEELSRTAPLLVELNWYCPLRPRCGNALALALHDRKILEGEPFPEDRRPHLLDCALDDAFPVDQGGYGARTYKWLLRRALMDPRSIPSGVLRAATPRPWYRADFIAILRARGEEAEGIDADAAMREAMEFLDSGHLQGYCLLLASLAREDPRRAAALLPPAGDDTPNEGEVMLAETLREATGQDLGLDLARWKKWLAGQPVHE